MQMELVPCDDEEAARREQFSPILHQEDPDQSKNKDNNERCGKWCNCCCFVSQLCGNAGPVVPRTRSIGHILVRGQDDRELEFNFNLYSAKKTVAKGLLDVALLFANAAQLRWVLQVGLEHKYYYVSLVLLVLSLMLQVAVGVMILYTGKQDLSRPMTETQAWRLDFWNNAVTLCVFLITVINLFVTAFDANYDYIKLRRDFEQQQQQIPVAQLVQHNVNHTTL